MRSVALAELVHAEALGHLRRQDGQEDLCFGLWFPSQGTRRTTMLLERLLLPRSGDRRVHGNASFMPAYFERALSTALNAGAGLAFLHSHPAHGWQGLSGPDFRAEAGMAAGAQSATGLPLLGMTLGALDGTWSARTWTRSRPRTYEPIDCATVRVVGGPLRMSFHPDLEPEPRVSRRQVRTQSAWGPATQATLARVRVGVVGLGSVGMLVAEALARMGVRRLTLIDFDQVEDHNLDRLLHATRSHAGRRAAKVRVAERALRSSATGTPFEVDALELSVCEEDGFRAAIDCDVLFSCVDRPWPRSVLNFIAFAHLIPVVDGGIHAFRTPSGKMRGAEWKAHVAAPTRACLECLKQFDAGLVAADREGRLDDPKYIETLPEDHPVRARENVFAFAMATGSLEVLQLVLMLVVPGGIADVGAQCYHLTTGAIDLDTNGCSGNCAYPPLVARGEMAGHPGTGEHDAARLARESRVQSPKRRARTSPP